MLFLKMEKSFVTTTFRIFSGLFIVLVWCLYGTLTYTIHRLEDERGQTGSDLEIDFYSNLDAKKFYENFNRLHDRPDSPIEPPPPLPRPPPHEVSAFESSDDFNSTKRLFIVFLNEKNQTVPTEGSNAIDSWSVIWYVASFGGLIAFFLVVSCSEWCCRRAVRNNCNSHATGNVTTSSSGASPHFAPDNNTPPPSYEEFAPPSYESICLGRNGHEKSEYDIYVVPVHALDTIIDHRQQEDEPPSYLSASNNLFTPAYPPPTPRRTDNN